MFKIDLRNLPPTIGSVQMGAGRDIYSRMVHGARYSIGMTLIIVVSAALLGTVWGGLAGFFGGRIDQGMMRVVDIFLAFPYFILALAIASALGRGMTSAVLALVLVWWPGYARMIRGQVLSIKEDLFVEAARAIGVSTPRLILRHILPQTTNELNARITLDMGYILLALTGLSFLRVRGTESHPRVGRDGGRFAPVYLSGLVVWCIARDCYFSNCVGLYDIW